MNSAPGTQCKEVVNDFSLLGLAAGANFSPVGTALSRPAMHFEPGMPGVYTYSEGCSPESWVGRRDACHVATPELADILHLGSGCSSWYRNCSATFSRGEVEQLRAGADAP